MTEPVVRASPSGRTVDVAGGSVSSVFARTGDVVAELGDYTTELVQNLTSWGGFTLGEALEAVASRFAALNTSDVLDVSIWNTAGNSITDTFDRIALRFDGIDQRLDGIDARLDNLGSSNISNQSTLVGGGSVTQALDELWTTVDNLPGIPVTSVFGRVGDIFPMPNDYGTNDVRNDSTSWDGATATDALQSIAARFDQLSATQVQNTSDVDGANVSEALDALLDSVNAFSGSNVTSVFGRQGDVVAETNDYGTNQIQNESGWVGDSLTEALTSVISRFLSLNSSEVQNASVVTGIAVTQALNAIDARISALGSTAITNQSTVSGATVSAALNTLAGVLLGSTFLGAASRLVGGIATISCPAGTRKVLVRMSGSAGGGGGAETSPMPDRIYSGGGGGGAGAEQEFLYTSNTDITSISVNIAVGASGATPPAGDAHTDVSPTTVTIKGDVFTSNNGEGGLHGRVSNASGSWRVFDGRGGKAGEFNFQSGSSFILLRSSGGEPGFSGRPGFEATGYELHEGGHGGSNTFGGGGRGGLELNGSDGTGNGSGGGGGSSGYNIGTSQNIIRGGGIGRPGAATFLFFT